MSMDARRWLAHFSRNKEGRPEPQWDAPITLPPRVVRQLVRSLEQFQLGDGGGPASLIAYDAESFRGDNDASRQLVDLWFAEEKEHSRLLGKAVERFGGTPIAGHWSFTAFCLCRRWLGVRFELTVLLLTEIASTGYYRLMKRHGEDEPLRAMCRLILRDEAGHILFHRDRMAREARAAAERRSRPWQVFLPQRHGRLWEARFRALGLAAATMLWINHAGAIKSFGGSTREFYREVWQELSGFVRRLRREARVTVSGHRLRGSPAALRSPLGFGSGVE